MADGTIIKYTNADTMDTVWVAILEKAKSRISHGLYFIYTAGLLT